MLKKREILGVVICVKDYMENEIRNVYDRIADLEREVAKLKSTKKPSKKSAKKSTPKKKK